MKNKIKRSTVVIKGSFQLRLALLAFFSSFAAALIIGLDIFFSINNVLKSFSMDPELVSTLKHINSILLVIMIVYSIIIFASSFFISHKIAGPVYRFEKTCEEVQNGDLTLRVKLRKNDALFDLQEKFNLMLQNIQEKVIIIDRLCSELEVVGHSAKAREIREEIKKQFTIYPSKFQKK